MQYGEGQDKREVGEEQAAVSYLDVAVYGLMSSLGISFVMFSPVAMILAHCRLPEPWSKVSCLLGAVLAVVVLQIPIGVVVSGFVLGILIADGVKKDLPLWGLVRRSFLVAGGLSLGALLWLSVLEGLSPAVFWVRQVDLVIATLKAAVEAGQPGIQWDVMRSMMLYEGPFLVLSMVLLSLWLSVGLAAHFRWLEGSTHYSAKALRELKLPKWASLLFLVLMAGFVVGGTELQKFVGGAFRLAGTFMFLQGCVFVSRFFESRMVPVRLRTLMYCAGIGLGFYALVGIGAVAPLLKFRKSQLEEV